MALHPSSSPRSLALVALTLGVICLCGCEQNTHFTNPNVRQWWEKVGAARAEAVSAPTNADAQRKWLTTATGLSQRTAIEALANPREAKLLAQTVLSETDAAAQALLRLAPNDAEAMIVAGWASAAQGAPQPSIEKAWDAIGAPATALADAAAKATPDDPQYVRSAADLRLYLYARLPDLVRPSPLGDVASRIWSAREPVAAESRPDPSIVQWRRDMRTSLIGFYEKAAQTAELSAWPHQTLAWLYDLDPAAVAAFGQVTTTGQDAQRATDEWGRGGALYERNVYLPLMRAVRLAEMDQATAGSGIARPDGSGAKAAMVPLLAAGRCSKLDAPRLAIPKLLGQAWQDAAGTQGLMASPRFLPGLRRLAQDQCAFAAVKAKEGQSDVAEYLLSGGVKWCQALLNSDAGERLTVLAACDALGVFAESSTALAQQYPQLRPVVAQAQEAIEAGQKRRALATGAYGGGGAAGDAKAERK